MADPSAEPDADGLLRGRTVGILTHLLAGAYFGSLLVALTRAASERGARTIAFQTQNIDWDNPASVDMGRLGWGKIDGFVVVIESAPESCLQSIRDTGKPLVLISHRGSQVECPVVLPDNHSGVAQAVEHLLGHGHTRIAFTGNTRQYDIAQRYEAYGATLRRNGVEPDPTLFYPTQDNRASSGRAVARQLLAAGLPSTAIFAATDDNAIGLIDELVTAGYSVPHDQAVVGFDDMPGADLLTPSLSTVRQDFVSVGRTAIDILGRHLAGQPPCPDQHLVATSFVPRASCGCIGLFPTAVDLGPADVRATNFAAQIKLALEARGGATASTARQIAEWFNVARERDLVPLELLRLQQLAGQLHHRELGETIFSVVTLARSLANQIEGDHGGGAPLRARLDACVQHVGIGMASAAVRAQLKVHQEFVDVVWGDYGVSLDLLRGHEKDPRSLEWMSKTLTIQAVLALWTDRDGKRELEVVGTFDATSGRLDLPTPRLQVEMFPPDELMDASAQGEDRLSLVIPLRTESSDWGYLALVTPIDSNLTDQETYFQWAALLSQALDYEAVTSSLRHSNTELASSYERERALADSIKHSEQRYALASRAANDGLWDWDMGTGGIYYSARWKEMLGYREDEVGTSPQEWLARVHREDAPALMKALAGRGGGHNGPFQNEHRILSSDGTYKWALCRGLVVRDDDGRVTRVVGSLTDITERRTLEELLQHQALYDNLTGLPNRALFLDRLAQTMRDVQRDAARQYSVLWLDLDGFKLVNDSLGHLAGDKLLISVAERLSAALRKNDTAARFGGDEFVILLGDVPGPQLVDQVVARLQEDLRVPYTIDGEQLVVTASIGIASSLNGYQDPEDVLRDADLAMYKAKSAGRAGSAIFDSSMHSVARARLQTETALRQAIERSQLILYYQPIVSLTDGRVRSVEALARWHRSDHGLVMPEEFLPIAEDSGLVVSLGRWAQGEACRQIATWGAAGLVSTTMRVGINVSHREFWDAGLIRQVTGALSAAGVPATKLALEITEGVIMHNVDRALALMYELHDLGIQIHVDDFGTGHSSLEALHRLPIDALKIDRSFVLNLPNGKSAELVRTIVQLGHNLGVSVIAEGIETALQHQMLVEAGCLWGQGFRFAKPVPGRELGTWLASNLAGKATSH